MNSKVYFISDTHFGHANAIVYCNRPFVDTDEMDKAMISKWNNTVAKHDKVYFLGDFAMTTNKERLAEWFKQLNGNIYMVKGNHDCRKNNFYREIGFKEVYDKPILYSEFYILSHEPVRLYDNTPYINIHGHLHNEIMTGGKYFNAGVDVNNFTPVLFTDIVKLFNNG
jgi:calcineurin-like phosphoesterase family protein